MDSAFFSDKIVSVLDEMGIQLTLSFPFERFVELKKRIQEWGRWRSMNETWSFFECVWKPKKWEKTYHFLFIRRRCATIRKEPIQLDLFVPHEYGYQFKVIVTNKWSSGKKILMYHNGRAAQESVFGELKSQGQMDYIPVRGLLGNELYLLAAVLSHNLNRELQMASRVPHRETTEKRAPLWIFEKLPGHLFASFRNNPQSRRSVRWKPGCTQNLIPPAPWQFYTKCLYSFGIAPVTTEVKLRGVP
jgi:hypothetical protein